MGRVTTDLESAKARVLIAMASSNRSTLANVIGRNAFPEVDFKNKQGAAFASAKLRRELMDAGLIRLDGMGDGYILSKNGRAFVHDIDSTIYGQKRPKH